MNVTEEDIQRAYAQICIEKMLTAQYIKGDINRAIVPPHWREEATRRAQETKK